MTLIGSISAARDTNSSRLKVINAQPKPWPKLSKLECVIQVHSLYDILLIRRRFPRYSPSSWGSLSVSALETIKSLYLDLNEVYVNFGLINDFSFLF